MTCATVFLGFFAQLLEQQGVGNIKGRAGKYTIRRFVTISHMDLAGMEKVRREWDDMVHQGLSPADLVSAMHAAIMKHTGEMTTEELQRYADKLARMNYDGDLELARRGLPQSGNGPLRPQ